MMFLTGADIEAIRKRLGLTQEAFAELLGVTDGAVCLWESNQRRPRYPMMEKLNAIRDKHKIRVPSDRRQLQPA
jgi:DNA-binding transcriptional regulator YiaG